MKKQLLSLLALTVFSFTQSANAQSDSYWVSSGEMIFSWSDAQFTESFMTQNPGASLVDNPVRFTVFLHLGQYYHYDFSNNIGIFTGLGLRNVGMITDEVLPQTVNTGAPDPDADMQNYKIIRRQYMLGVPLALKIGAFDNSMYFFGGGEIEWAFVYKQKYWNTHDRGGDKTKAVDWFGNQTPALIPSVFGGVQFPGGINIRFKYYLTDFLNHDYKQNTTGNFNVGDLTRYEKSQLMYVSVCYQIRYGER